MGYCVAESASQASGETQKMYNIHLLYLAVPGYVFLLLPEGGDEADL
jgi:hypothetical protein